MAYVSRSSEQASIFPANNLPSDSKLWGQNIEKRLFNIENNFNAAEVNNLTRDSQLISNYNRLDVAVTKINGILDDLGLLNDNVFGPGGLEEAIANVTDVVIDSADPTKINGLNLKAGTVLADNVVSTYVYAGEISADKITAGTIDATEITITNINADNITTGTIDAETVTINNLNADNITSGSINANDITITNIDADNISGGTITGTTIQTAGPSKIIMDNASNSLKFTNSGGSTVANVFPGTSAGGESGVYISYSSIPDVNAQNFLKLSDQGFALRAGAGGVVSGYGSSLNFTGSSGITFNSPTQFSSGITGGLNLSGGLQVGTINSTGAVSLSSTFETGSTIRRTQLDGGGTTTASFNDAGYLQRTSSSARYKQDIQDAEFDYDSIINLKPKTFRLKEEAESNPNAITYPGFIAEEIAGTPLDIFVNYEKLEDGTYRPDGVRYQELTAALVSAVKHQDSLIKDLTARLEALEGKVQ